MLKSFRYLLLPISWLYGAAVWLRNKLYDKNILKSSSFNFPVICVGNLATGGTGKTPMTEFLVRFLKSHYKVATKGKKKNPEDLKVTILEATKDWGSYGQQAIWKLFL